mmetsp:Transcript_25784/g.65007  ORF Transcript_25784/g.65007 Transcript_25784/m.65007 type:complete len:207 (-) Transcript_25784:4197-4817(-)
MSPPRKSLFFALHSQARSVRCHCLPSFCFFSKNRPLVPSFCLRFPLLALAKSQLHRWWSPTLPLDLHYRFRCYWRHLRSPVTPNRRHLPPPPSKRRRRPPLKTTTPPPRRSQDPLPLRPQPTTTTTALLRRRWYLRRTRTQPPKMRPNCFPRRPAGLGSRREAAVRRRFHSPRQQSSPDSRRLSAPRRFHRSGSAAATRRCRPGSY